jgi:hypothetical protein
MRAEVQRTVLNLFLSEAGPYYSHTGELNWGEAFRKPQTGSFPSPSREYKKRFEGLTGVEPPDRHLLTL